MPDAKATPSASAESDDLRLVLFGMPAAGKSSLLGALGEAANSQQALLGGRLVDRDNALTQLSRSLYGDGLRQTPDEVVPYLVEFEPLKAGQASKQKKVGAVLVDCDGRVANNLIQRRQSLDENSREGTLAHEIIEADTLILVVDSSATSKELEADFAEFNRFLKIIESDRGSRVEVGGLPVFLVLTKCDLLARPGDGAAAWIEHIEQRKREVDAHFREFLAREESREKETDSARNVNKKSETLEQMGEQGPPEVLPADSAQGDGAFGRIELHVWATAVKRPTLRGVPVKPNEPFGVAELFRLSIAEARRHRERCERSSRRLIGTVIASALIAAAMLVLAVTLLIVNRNTQAAMLQARVEDFEALDRGGPAHRLRGTLLDLKEKQERLQDIRNDKQFPAIRPDLREFIEDRLDELAAYIPYYDKVLEERLPDSDPFVDGLNQRIARLKKDLVLPREEWAGTPAAILVRQRLEAATALQQAIQAIRNWYLDAGETAERLRTFAGYRSISDIDWEDWSAQVEKLVDPNRKPPFKATDPLPGAPASLLTYATAMRFDKVIEARADWEAERSRLIRVLRICSVIGLAPATTEHPAVLVIPRSITLAACKTRLTELAAVYPDYRTIFVRDAIPEAVLPRVRQTARKQYQALLEPARAEVLQQLRKTGKEKEETAERWESVRLWLRAPAELAAWRVLAGVLLNLSESTPTDPVAELASFLGKKQFTLDPKSLSLEIPDLRGIAPRAESRFTIHQKTGDQEQTLSFEPAGDPRRDTARGVTVYTFRSGEGQRLVYQVGDTLWAELPLRGAKERLVWSQSRSALYQFGRLHNPPRLQPIDATTLIEGRRLDDVRLSFSPVEGVPRVPDLMPPVEP